MVKIGVRVEAGPPAVKAKALFNTNATPESASRGPCWQRHGGLPRAAALLGWNFWQQRTGRAMLQGRRIVLGACRPVQAYWVEAEVVAKTQVQGWPVAAVGNRKTAVYSHLHRNRRLLARAVVKTQLVDWKSTAHSHDSDELPCNSASELIHAKQSKAKLAARAQQDKPLVL